MRETLIPLFGHESKYVRTLIIIYIIFVTDFPGLCYQLMFNFILFWSA